MAEVLVFHHARLMEGVRGSPTSCGPRATDEIDCRIADELGGPADCCFA